MTKNKFIILIAVFFLGMVSAIAQGIDTDGDGIVDDVDNCINTPNPDQLDADSDGHGAVCDCNDSDAAINPAATEICDGIDNDCDGQVDEDFITTFYLDFDIDGFGDPNSTASGTTCNPPVGNYVTNNTDCNDSDDTVRPNVLWYKDADADGYGNPADSKASCTKPFGYVADNNDCDDGNGNINPVTIWYIDSPDNDGWGSGTGVTGCTPPADGNTYVLNKDDVDGNTDQDSDNDGLNDAVENDVNSVTDVNNPDTDGDGLTDGVEVNTYKSDPSLKDTDGDGIDDGKEVNTYKSSPTSTDTDGDGLKDNEELSLGTEMTMPDTDSDGIKDGDEVNTYQSDPKDSDTDNDGLSDGFEVNTDAGSNNTYRTSPTKADSDGDGLNDKVEIEIHKTNPNKADSDSDGLNDSDEIKYTTDPWVADTDGDGLNDGDEIKVGSDPFIIDSDGDGINDKDEVNAGSDPTSKDTDGDTIDDGDEVNVYGTDPSLPDTDFDGCDDATEIAQKTDPILDTDNNYKTYYADTDGDGFGDVAISQNACSQPIGYVLDNTDCNDKDNTINTSGFDVAGSGVDANCDGSYVWFVDADGDQFGTTTTVVSTNATPGVGESAVSTDFNDADATLNPDAVDVPGSGIDANGDGLYTWFADTDGDGFGTLTTVSSPNATPGTGESADSSDQNDTDATLNPGATDTPGSGIDANGDGQYAWFEDVDVDGHGSTTSISSVNATAGAGESATSDDCDDTDPDIYPGAPALPDGKDNDCDGTVDKIILTATVADQTRVYGEADPAFSITYTGFVGTDDASVIDTAPVASAAATTASDAGTYPITASGGTDTGYDFTYVEGTLTVSKATASIELGGLQQEHDGFEKIPTVITTPAGLGHIITWDGLTTAPTEVGDYAFNVDIDDINYTGQTTGSMSIVKVLGVDGTALSGIRAWPNPVTDRLQLEWGRSADRLLVIYDGTGKQVLMEKVSSMSKVLDLGHLQSGIYRLFISEENKKNVSLNIIKGR